MAGPNLTAEPSGLVGTVDLAPSTGPAPTPAQRRPSLAGLLTSCLLAATALFALWLRLVGLPGQDGTLSIDEARLALAARGILEHGLPIMSTGWVYTRGLIPSYLTAASFALLGPSDLAARLPSIVAGTALVPLAFALGRQVAGRPAGLFVAIFVATYEPLVTWSRQAWFYSIYTALFAAALLFILRAHRAGRDRDQLLAGLFAAAAPFAHEFGLFLAFPLLAQVGLRLARVGRRSGRWLAPALAVGLFAAAAALVLLFATQMRAATLAGGLAEVDEYVLRPRFNATSLRFYTGLLVDGRGLMLAAALVGAPLALLRRRADTALLWLGLLPNLLHLATLQNYDRYGLTMVLVLVILAGQGAALLARELSERLPSLGLAGGPATLGLLTLILALHVDPREAIDVSRQYRGAGGWLLEARRLGIDQDDLVMTDLPTVVDWYIGDVDFWARSRMFEKYTLRDAPLRDAHTGALLVRNLFEYRRLVAEASGGQPIWVLASGREGQWGSLLDPTLRTSVEQSADLRVRPNGSSYVQFSERSAILRIDRP